MIHRCICSQYSLKAPPPHHHPKKTKRDEEATASPATPAKGGRGYRPASSEHSAPRWWVQSRSSHQISCVCK